MVPQGFSSQCVNVVVTEILNSGDFTHTINLPQIALCKYKYAFETQRDGPRTLYLLVCNFVSFSM